MTIQQKLHDHYEKVIGEVRKVTYDEALKILKETNTETGICNCASEEFKTEIYNSAWVMRHGHVWYSFPFAQPTVEEIITALTYRLNILKKLL